MRAFFAKNKKLLLFLAVLFYLYFRGIGDHGLLDPIEGVNASVAIHMSASGNYFVPRMGESAVAGRSLGSWWLAALALRVLGWWEFPARLWSALAGLGMVLASALASRRHPWLNASVCASMTLGFVVSQLSSSHALYACCTGFSMTAFLRASMILNDETEEEEWHSLWKWLLLAHLMPLLALVAHGPEGLLLPWLTLLVFSILAQRFTTLAECWAWWPGALLSLLGTAGYLFLLWVKNPLLLDFLRSEAPRLLTPDWRLVPLLLLAGATPWQGFLLTAARDATRRWLETIRTGAPMEEAVLPKLFLLLWAFVFGLAALMTGDLLALAACVPPLAALAGDSLGERLERGDLHSIQSAVATSIVFLVPLLVVGIPLTVMAFPSLRAALLSLVPWGGFVAFFLFVARYYARGGKGVMTGARPLKLARNVSAAALLCLMPLAGVFDLSARELSLQGVGTALRSEIQPGDVLAQYAVNRPSLYFYTLHSSALVNGPLLPGVASKALLMDDTALHLLWAGKDRVFLLLPLKQPLSSLSLDVYNVAEANGMAVLSNR